MLIQLILIVHHVNSIKPMLKLQPNIRLLPKLSWNPFPKCFLHLWIHPILLGIELSYEVTHNFIKRLTGHLSGKRSIELIEERMVGIRIID